MSAHPISKTPRLSYDRARGDIRDGDMIAVRGTRGLMAWAIRLVTGSPYTHTGVALWVGSRLMVIETRQGPASLVPLSHYEHVEFDVFPAPLAPLTLALGRDTMLNTIGAPIVYAWGDIFRVALHELVGVPLPRPSARRLICSSLTELIYRRLGWSPLGLPSIPTPRDLVRAVGMAPRMEVRRHG